MHVFLEPRTLCELMESTMSRIYVMTLGHTMKSVSQHSVVRHSRNALTRLDVDCKSLSNVSQANNM